MSKKQAIFAFKHFEVKEGGRVEFQFEITAQEITRDDLKLPILYNQLIDELNADGKETGRGDLFRNPLNTSNFDYVPGIKNEKTGAFTFTLVIKNNPFADVVNGQERAKQVMSHVMERHFRLNPKQASL